MSNMEDFKDLADRIRSNHSVIKSLRSGKPDASTTAVVQEVISILQNLNHPTEVLVAGLKFMQDALSAAPHTSTLIRLEGGIKIFFKIMRTNNLDSQLVALCASVLCKCCTASNVTLIALVKEKSLGSTLISAVSSHPNNTSVIAPLCELLALLANHPRGASQLADDGIVGLCKELLVNFLGNWPIFGMVLKLVKNMAKHEGPCAALARNPNMGRLLLGVARLLARLPDQGKLLKRTSRALWLLHRSSLAPLPPMEPPLPLNQAAPHLNILSAMDADAARHMELFPEDYALPVSPPRPPPAPHIGPQQTSHQTSAPHTPQPLPPHAHQQGGPGSAPFSPYPTPLSPHLTHINSTPEPHTLPGHPTQTQGRSSAELTSLPTHMRAPMPPPQQHTHASQNSFPPATSVNVSSTAAPPPPPVSYFTTSSVPNPTASHHRATPDYAASADECSGAATTAVPSTVPVSGMGVDGIRDSACGLHTYNSAGSEELPFSSHVYSSSGIVDATHSAANNVASGGTLHQLAHSSLSSSGVADASHIRRDRGARTVRTQREAAVPPPSAAAQTAAGVLAAAASAGMGGVPPEPFHNWGGSTLGLDMMMHDLRRLVHPEAVLNRCVYVNVPDRIPSSRHRVEEKAEQGPPPSQAGPRSRTRAARNGPQGTPSVTCPDSTQFGDQLLAAAVRRGHLLSPLSSAAALQNGGGSLGGAAWRAPSSQAQPSLGSLGKAGLLPRMNQPGASKRDLGTGLKASSSAARPPGIAPKSGSPWMGPGPEAPAIGGGASVAQSGPLPPLQFESNFESGNLRAAVQVYENEYDLFLATDLNDRSEGGNLCQWFYFAVTGVQPGVPYKFNLVNFRKKQSLFASGVQPLVCCCRDVGVSSSSQNAFSADNSVCPDGPVSDSVALSLQQQQQQQQPDPSCCRRSLDSAAFSYTSGVSTLSRANSGSSNTFGSSNVPSQYQPARLSPQPYSQLSPTQSLSQLPNAKIEQQQQPLQQQRGERSGRLSAQGMLSPSLSRVGSARADPSRSPSTSTQPSHHMHRPTPPPSRPPLGSRSSTTNSSNRSSADFTPSNPHHPHSQQQQPQQQQQQQQQQPHQTWGCVHGLCNMPGTWARSGSHVAYYPSPYRGRPTTTGVAEPGPKRGVKKSSSSNSKKASGRSSSSTNPSISAPTAGAAATPTTASNASGATAGVATAGSGSMTAGAAQGGGSSSGRGSGRGDGKGGEGVGLGGPVYGDAGPGLYCCTFTLQFPETHATYYIASCYPYTYTDLQEHLDLLTVRLDPSHHSPHSLTDHHQQHHQQQHEVQQQQIQQQTTTQQPHPPYPLQQQHHQQHHQQLLQQQPQHPFEATGTQIRQSSGAASSHRYPQSSDSVPSLSIAPLSIPPLSAPEPLNPRDLESQPPTVIGGMLVRSLLCYTLAGHRVECLTITDFNAPLDLIQQREAIVLTARVHPGESNASWIMQGVLDFLTSDAPAALTLRKSFVFKIVPMLNPDGVINGSYRCSLAGVDLNRTWEHPVKWLHPSVYHTKKVLAQLASACRLALYVDIHGHSNKEDAFFYGCEPNVAGLDKTPPPPTPATTVVASNTGQGGGGGQMASPARPGFLSRPGGSAFEVDAPVPGGYITSGCDGLNWEAPGSLAAMPLMFVPPAMQSSALSVSGTSNWPTAQAAPQQVAGQQGWAGAAGNTMVIAGSQPPSARQAARLRVRMLPYLASCISTDYSLSKCGFRIRRAKLGAARVVAYRELGCAGAYTLEASLGGRAQGRSHFSAADYIGLGENLCRGVAALAEVDDAALLEDMAKNVTLPPMPASFS